MPHQYVPRMINLEQSYYNTVRRLTEELGLSEKGFSAALRMIIHEWSQLQDPCHMITIEIRRLLERQRTSEWMGNYTKITKVFFLGAVKKVGAGALELYPWTGTLDLTDVKRAL